MTAENRNIKIHGAYKVLLIWVAFAALYVYFVHLPPGRRDAMLFGIIAFYVLNIFWYISRVLGLIGRKK